MLNFFVNLINSIGVPVVFIGTNSMVQLFSHIVRNARRVSGQGIYDFKQPIEQEDTKYASMNSRVDLDEFIESTVATAVAEKEQAKVSVPKSVMLKDIHEKRGMERDAERLRALAHAPGGELPMAPQVAAPARATTQEYAGERGAEVISLLSRAGRAGAKK
jgi:hypothetical protein